MGGPPGIFYRDIYGRVQWLSISLRVSSRLGRSDILKTIFMVMLAANLRLFLEAVKLQVKYSINNA